ncbi:MAG TPA: prephenate dehydratase [Polyangiales bacterium]|nr:prephenate dehydratase [Polyangiales bacterium]
MGYQGTDGAYSQIAAEHHWQARRDELTCRGYDSFADLLQAVIAEEIDYAMQPIENTTAGSINEAYDLLAHMDLHLVGEEVLKVEHCLLALLGTEISQLRRVYSHPQALLQCSEFLASLPDCQVLAFTDTAMAVKKVRDERDPVQAAVGSERAGALYGLSALAHDIANQRNNFTRFVAVAKVQASYPVTTPCKTSLIFTTKHERGALVRCLNILADHDLSLTKLESRPRPNKPWEYIFYVDFEGNVADPKIAAAVEQVRDQTLSLKMLGSYPTRTWHP